MRVDFLGAAGTVTGSKYLVTHGDECVLVDCGLFQGLKQWRLKNWAPWPVEPSRIASVALTHAHLDHSGYLPLLVKNGFRGSIHCTEATFEICKLLLPDSGRLQEEDAAFANRHGFSKHDPALPLYTEEDANIALRYFRPCRCDEDVGLAPGVVATFRPNGHILGSASITLRSENAVLAFSGDLGRQNDPIMLPPRPIDAADYLLIESTYGDRAHAEIDPADELAQVVNRTLARGGVIVIPSFAIGRAQALLHIVAELKSAARIPRDLPVFLNSPMAVDATRLYQRFHEEHRLDAAACDAMGHAAKYVNTVEESKHLNTLRQPMIIIAASGMATGGRVVHHLKTFAPNERNTILFSGYQAVGTRGAKLLAGASEVRIHGEDVPVRAEVAALSSMSAHADAAEILLWLKNFGKAPRRTFITHGEPVAADALRQRIERELRWQTHVPDYREGIELT